MKAHIRQWLTFGGYCLVCLLTAPVPALAAPESPAGGGYLSGYTETAPQAVSVSWWSTLAYLLSLLAVFAFVAAAAYFVSKFLAKRVNTIHAGGAQGGRMLAHLPLAPNRSVCIVEMLGHVFILGVAEHSISLLREIIDPAELEQLHRQALLGDANGAANYTDSAGANMDSLQQFVKRIPSLFRNDNDKD